MGLVIKILIGLGLFVGSLVGGLAATGRLNHDGCANIPVLNALFPAPAPAGEADAAGEHGEAGAGEGHAAADPHGKPEDAPATPSAESKTATDASHEATPAPQGEQAPRKQKVGRSLVEPEDDGGGGHGGGGEAAGGHGEAKKDGGHEAADAHGKDAQRQDEHGKDGADGHGKGGNDRGRGSPEADFQGLEDSLANGRSQYKPGDLFRFQGLPAGVTPEQINEAWQRVQSLVAEIERRKVVLDQQEQQLRELSEDISRRQAALNKESVEIEQMHRKLDTKIQKFQEQVKMVRTDEVAALKKNGATLASFEPKKAAELLEVQWKTDKGQDEVLKVLEFMDKDAVNAILNEMPPSLTSEVMKKRQRVSKEPAPSGKGS